MSPREIKKDVGISPWSVKKMVKRKGLKQFKRLTTQRMSEGTRERRTVRAGALAERIRTNSRNIENCLARLKRFHSRSTSRSTKQLCICEWQQKRC